MSGTLRRILLASLSMLAVGGAARAQDWRVYSFQDAGFSAQFPAQPKAQADAYPVPADASHTRSAPATTYWVQQGPVRYSAVVVDLSKAEVDRAHLVEREAAILRREGEVQLDQVVSMAVGCGRNLGVQGADGRQTFLAVFAPNDGQKLYVLRAAVPAGEPSAGADALRFQQSLNFLGDAKSAPQPTNAAGWKDYAYLDTVGFAVRFPAPPQVATVRYITDDGVTVPATRYTARDGQALYRVTVADLWKSPADRDDVLDAAVDVLRRDGEVTSDQLQSIQFGQCGRDLALAEPEGRRASVGVYFPTSQHKLFIVEASAPEGELKAKADQLALFRQSFRLTKYPDNTP